MANKTRKREELIMEELQKNGKMTIKEMVLKFDVSEPTARRISTSLANQNKVVRTHGGIQLLPNSDFKYSFSELESRHIEEKQRIAQYASKMISDNDVIYLESGTTIHHLATALAARLQKNELKNLTVFTNSLNNLLLLSTLCQVTVIGGEYRPERRDFAGYITEKLIKCFNFKYSFLGADAINLNEGVMAAGIDTVRFDELLVTRSEHVVILADSTKFNMRSLVSYASIDEIDTIITDKNLPASVQSDYTNSGVNIVCV